MDRGGEWVGLSDAAGRLVHSLEYPALRRNVSFGRARCETTEPVVVAGAAARVWVPGDDALGQSWTELGFNDGAWVSTTTPVGFSLQPTPRRLLALDFNDREDNSASATATGFEPFVIGSGGGDDAIQSGRSAATSARTASP
ncbi:MAG: hypothetical protein FJ387_23405 [Verrucomicrobia bacterium]|nr:hypothetical protein [Verrucomicrobiota bacterium]